MTNYRQRAHKIYQSTRCSSTVDINQQFWARSWGDTPPQSKPQVITVIIGGLVQFFLQPTIKRLPFNLIQISNLRPIKIEITNSLFYYQQTHFLSGWCDYRLKSNNKNYFQTYKNRHIFTHRDPFNDREQYVAPIINMNHRHPPI